MYKIFSELSFCQHAFCFCDFLTAKLMQHFILLWHEWTLSSCMNMFFFSSLSLFNVKPQVQKEITLRMNTIWSEVMYISCVTDLFWQRYPVYPLHWKSSRACPFACSLDSWPAMNCVLKGLKERVNEVKINEAREHHHLKAVSSSMPHL